MQQMLVLHTNLHNSLTISGGHSERVLAESITDKRERVVES